MTDQEYHQLIDDLFINLEEQVDACEVDLDYESASGILEIIFPDNSKIILNKQAPLQQLWVATKFNGHHFERHGDKWIDNRSGSEFWQFMNDAASKQAGTSITWEAE
ncbi:MULTISPECIES: iron donor protein CyaY [Pseudoalteromonas]|uniref:iron donor protein CyaY n=1 Tax=Pseudoalteromonas TaxID=53246 RepID=UPI000C2D0402|nr:iron donor protein CyaY [Pseudoalteromonas spongiae]TMO82502.1 iron donor protein CyaY [Pseudoalteromonas spongiae]